jgi:hypothetical protein
MPGCNEGDDLLRAKRIEARFELVGGPVAMADVGDYLLENDQIRVAILGAKDSPGPGVFGGSVVDIDRRRPRIGFEGGQGRDRFAETFPLANLLVPDPTAADVRVLRDGSDGEEASIRVEGEGQFLFEALGILRVLEDVPAELNPFPGVIDRVRFRTDYILRPGDRHITIETTLLAAEPKGPTCPALACDDTCEHGRQVVDGCPVCTCSERVTLANVTAPVSVFGTMLGDPLEGGAPPVRRAGVVAGDFVFFGNQNDVFAPGPGFDEEAAVQDATNEGRNSFQVPLTFDFVAAAGGDISYGYFTAGAPGGAAPVVNVPLFASAATSFLSAQQSCLVDAADDEACDHQRAFFYRRYLAVGDGDIASVTDEMYRVRGVVTGRVRGHVYWAETGEPAANAQVLVMADPDPGRAWVSASELAEANRRARGDTGVMSAIDADLGLDLVEDGDFSGPLPAGDYVLFARDEDGTTTSDPIPLRVESGAEVVVNAFLEAPATVEYRVTDGAGLAMPAKLSFVSLSKAGAPLERDGLRKPYFGEGRLGDGVRAIATTASGEGTIQLEPGRYRVIVSRGMEYGLYEEDFEIYSGDVRRVDAALVREIDTTGYLSADMHLHSRPSFDSGMPIDRRVVAAAAEGVELAVSTDHDVATDYRPVLTDLRLSPFVATAIGAEITTLEQGHFVGFPLAYDELTVPMHGAHDWTCEPGGEILDAIRASGDGGRRAFTIVAHPRDGFFGYVDQVGVDTYTMNRELSLLEANNPVFRTASCDFDAMELINGKRFDLMRTPTVAEVADWNRCLGRIDAATTVAELDGACPEVAPGLLAPCTASDRFAACKSRNRTRLAWEMMKRVIARTPEEQGRNWHFAGTTEDSRALCDLSTLGEAPVPAEAADEPCTFRAGQIDDVFRYLEHGMVRTQIASSDSHDGSIEPGSPRTYFRSATDSPAALSIDDAIASLRGGHALATYGPFVRASIGDASFGDVASARPGDEIHLDLEVSTASWFGVDRVEIYMNGELVRVETPDEPPSAIVDLRGAVRLTVPDRDSWVMIVAMGLRDDRLMTPVALSVPYGDIQLSKVASDAFGKTPFISTFFSVPPTVPDWAPVMPYAVTNPIFIDTGKDGRYDAPLATPDFCSRTCQPGEEGQCPAGQECLIEERLCGVPVVGKCDHRRVAPGHKD